MEAEHETEGRLLLDVVIQKSAAILELFAGEGEELPAMTLVNGVGGLNLDGDGLSSEDLHENFIPAWRQSMRRRVDSFWMLNL